MDDYRFSREGQYVKCMVKKLPKEEKIICKDSRFTPVMMKGSTILWVLFRTISLINVYKLAFAIVQAEKSH